MRIADIDIGVSHPPFLIAEMSGNHNQSLERALKLVDAAADAGARPRSRTPTGLTTRMPRTMSLKRP